MEKWRKRERAGKYVWLFFCWWWKWSMVANSDERWWLALPLPLFRKRNKIFYVTMGHDICDVIFHNFAFCVPHRISIQHASILPLLYHFSALAIWDAPIKPNARDACFIRSAQRYWMIYIRTSPWLRCNIVKAISATFCQNNWMELNRIE